MRIGFLTGDLSHRHGWAHYSLSLLLALQRAGAQLTVITARNSPLVEGMTLLPLLPSVVPAQRGMLLRQARALPAVRAALRGCDVIHAMLEPYAPLAAWAAGRRPLLITAHGSYIRRLPGRRWPVGTLYAWALRRGRLICVSRYTAQVAESMLPGVRTVVINNGVDPQRFAHLPPSGPKSGPVVLAVGAVKPRKGTLELVQAMAEVRHHIPDAQCMIIGSLDAMPAYTAQVRAVIVAHNLQGAVHLLGHVPEPELMRWYSTADVFALPSLNVGDSFEGYGLVHAEASAAGLPVIGTGDCGAADAIIDGETGLLVSQARIAQELPQALITLLTDPARAAHMGAAGRQRAQSHTWDHVAAQMLALYNEGMNHA
jgi:phosphatidylinositol alpha-1,6-mannosyltransferase